MTAPIDHAVAELLHYLAKRNEAKNGVYCLLSYERPDLLATVPRAVVLGLAEHLGTGLDWPYLRLTHKGAVAVNEAIAAMREIT
jgi:hypothetical protein